VSLPVTVAEVPAEVLVRRGWRALLRVKLALVDRRRYQRTVLEHVAGLPVVVLRDVFNPVLLRTGAYLVDYALHAGVLRPGTAVLDLGSGAGAASVLAARHGCRVVAVDINPIAVRNTRVNALLNNVANDVDVRQGDLWAPLGEARFDVVLFNPPYYRGVPRDALDHAWRAPDVIERFATGLASHLTVGGQALVILSSDGEQEAFVRTLQEAGCQTRVVAERDLINEMLRVYAVTAGC
jgi:release factor glutamine methyltransferase